MNEAHIEKPASTLKLVGILFAFFLIGVFMFVWPILSAMDMLEEINSHAKYITLDKGAYYLFGGGLFFLIMVLGIPIGYLFKEHMAKTYGKCYGMSLIISVVIVFVLPQAVHYFTEKYAFDNNYVVCEAKSYQWLHARKIVYAKSLPCDE